MGEDDLLELHTGGECRPAVSSQEFQTTRTYKLCVYVLRLDMICLSLPTKQGR